MERLAESGLEVKLSTSPKVAAQPYEDKYYIGDEGSHYFDQNRRARSEQANNSGTRVRASNHPVVGETDKSSENPQTKSRGRARAIRGFALLAVVCLAVALGAGVGAGLAAQHKPNISASISTTSNCKAPITVTQVGDTTTITPAPATPPSQTCPAANGSTYTASNKPLITDVSQITQTTLAFEILCDTNTAEGGSVLDLQLITNVSTLNDCLNACALYNFQTKQANFPENACTGVSWGYAADPQPPHSCWLKNGVTLGSPNNTDTYPGYNGAVLLND